MIQMMCPKVTIRGLVAMLAGVAAFAAVSCQELDQNSMTLAHDTVRLSEGSMFISIQSTQSWELSVQYEGEQNGWIIITPRSGSGSTNSVILAYTANKAEDSRTAVITATFSKGTISARLTQRGLSSIVEGGEGTLLPTWPDYPQMTSEVVRGWMELPQVEEIENCAWVYHDMEVPSLGTWRNYSILYDAKNMFSRWVAYPLNSTLIGSGSRTDDWEQIDPKIPSSYQPYTAGTWGMGGYARGHQLPSADRLRDAANRATFYPTNMTVQDGGLNGGVWVNLESRVRTWMAMFDTLYVCTGAIPSDEFRRDRMGNSVNVPQGYFKALLGYNRPTEEMAERYIGIAFYFDNENPGSSALTRDLAMTISDLEIMTGFNFFVNLPNEFSTAAEKSISSRWTF